jgi:hypothetical protein
MRLAYVLPHEAMSRHTASFSWWATGVATPLLKSADASLAPWRPPRKPLCLCERLIDDVIGARPGSH